MTFSSDSFSLYTSTVQSDPTSSNAALLPHPAFQPLIPFLPILYLLPLLPHHRLLLLVVSLHLLLPLPPLTPSEFFNGMLVVSETGAPNCYTFFCLILLILFVSRNLILIHFPLSGSLNSLLCNLVAPTPGLAFSLLLPHMLAASSSYLSGRAYPSLNFLPPLFLCLTPTLIM